MRKIIAIFNKKEFLFFIFTLYLVLLTWPFLSIFDKGNPKLIFYYLFFMWALSILILFFISLGYSQKIKKEETLDT